jgi:hypothetical protein
LEVRFAAADPSPGSTTSGGATGTQGNQLDSGGKSAALPPMKSIGTIGPAEAGGSFREERFDIPAAMLAGRRHLAVRFFRQRDMDFRAALPSTESASAAIPSTPRSYSTSND